MLKVGCVTGCAGSRIREGARATTKIATRPPTQIAEARAFNAISGTGSVALIAVEGAPLLYQLHALVA